MWSIPELARQLSCQAIVQMRNAYRMMGLLAWLALLALAVLVWMG